MPPAPHGGEDGVSGLCPDERLGLVVCFGDEAVAGSLQFDDRCEDAAFEALPGKFGKQPLDCIGPGAGSRGEVESEALMALQPSRHPRLREGRLFGCLWVA